MLDLVAPPANLGVSLRDYFTGTVIETLEIGVAPTAQHCHARSFPTAIGVDFELACE